MYLHNTSLLHNRMHNFSISESILHLLLFYSLPQLTALHIAAKKKGYDSTVKCLIEQGANIEVKDIAEVSNDYC